MESVYIDKIIGIKKFISSDIDCKFLLYFTTMYEKDKVGATRLLIYYVDSNMKLRYCKTPIIFDNIYSENYIKRRFKEKIDNDRNSLMKLYGYKMNNIPAKGFNTVIAQRIKNAKNDFLKGNDAKLFADDLANFLGLNAENSRKSSLDGLICSCDIYCDFRNYSESPIGFDTVEVDIPLIYRGRTVEQQRNEIRRLRTDLEKVALNSIKEREPFRKSKLSIKSLYVSNLYHTRDNMLEFIFKVK